MALFLKQWFEPYVQEIRMDSLGNLVMCRRGEGPEPRPRLLLTAHMDEIGFLVSKIEIGGFLRFTAVGGIDARILLGQEVLVLGRSDVPGVIGAKPPHLLAEEERKKAPRLEDLFIDVGLPGEQLENVVQIGDPIVLKRDPQALSGESWTGKALDDRAGLAALYVCLRSLERVRVPADIFVVATVQEELGTRGATVCTFGLIPDIGIAVDVGFGEMPGLPEEDTIAMGEGPAIALGPNIHPCIGQDLIRLAKEHHIPHQIEVAPGPTGTDARAIQISRGGVAAGLLSIPLRYMHTPVEVVQMQDIISTGRLLALFAGQLDRAYLEGMRCY